MTLRTMLGVGWSILCGVAGGWMLLMPWALSVQGGGNWTTVTKWSFATGIGLLVFCLLGILITALHINQILARPRAAREAVAATDSRVDQANLDRALLELATKLVADLDAAPVAPAAAPVVEAPQAQAPTNGTPTPPAVPSSYAATANGEAAPTWRRVEQ